MNQVMMILVILVMMVTLVQCQVRVDNDIELNNRQPFILKTGELYR